MTNVENVINGLEELLIVRSSDVALHPKDFVARRDAQILEDALNLLKDLLKTHE